MNKFVQGIVIKDSHILMDVRKKSNQIGRSFFISGEVLLGETHQSALERIILDTFGFFSNVQFKINRESFMNMKTYLVEVADLKIEDNLEDKGFKWLSLRDKDAFTYDEKLELAGLLDTCLGRGYSQEWINPLEELILSDSRFSYSRSTIQSKKKGLAHREFDSAIGSSHRFTMILLSILIGFLFNSFFMDMRFGISVPIFAALLTSIFFFSNKAYIKKVRTPGILAIALSVLLSLNFAIHTNEFLMMINLLALPLLLTGSFILIRYEDASLQIRGLLVKILSRLFPQSFENFLKPIYFIKDSFNLKNKGKMSPAYKSVLIGLAASLPLLLIIVPLLSSADSVFNYYLSNASSIFSKLEFGTAVYDTIIISFVALYSFGFMWSFKYDELKLIQKEKTKGFLEPVSVLTVLIVINLVYLLFTVVQASYLYGGGNTALPNGFTYAEYARRGFFELVLVTIINFTIVVLSRRFTKEDNSSLNKVLRGVYTILIIFTLNMLYSANFKMSLYESAFGYTYLRVYVQLFLILLLLLFIIALSGIWSSRVKTAKLSIIVTLVMYLVVNYANVDVMIARKNIERFETTGKIDVHYLTTLSDDAVPELVKLVDSNKNNVDIKHVLGDNLESRSMRLDFKRPWYEFNLSRSRAKKAIDGSY